MENKNIRKVKVINWEHVGLNYEVCNEIYGDMTGKDIEGRMLSVGFWEGVLDSALENGCSHSNRMLSKVSGLDDNVLIEF
tara:strand:- start:264 stop:503 length:240 start_codon:yes stop_codon:yes gene_type:complete